jgi:hypothetical protein
LHRAAPKVVRAVRWRVDSLVNLSAGAE